MLQLGRGKASRRSLWQLRLHSVLAERTAKSFIAIKAGTLTVTDCTGADPRGQVRAQELGGRQSTSSAAEGCMEQRSTEPSLATAASIAQASAVD